MSYIPGPMYKTRFSELRFTMIAHGCWRFVDVMEPDNPALVGSSYPTREQLVANIERFAAEYGCEGADKTLRQTTAPEILDRAIITLVLDALYAALPDVGKDTTRKVSEAITALEKLGAR